MTEEYSKHIVAAVSLNVIPAKAGIQKDGNVKKTLGPRLRGGDCTGQLLSPVMQMLPTGVVE